MNKVILIDDIRVNPNNPRSIKDEQYIKLKNSLKEFPKMMKLRPIIIDNTGMILGGNMRYLAIKDLGYTEIPKGWVMKASELSEEEKKRFVIADNVEFGNFDYNILANEWDVEKLQEWGIELDELGDAAKIEGDYNIEVEEKVREYKKIHILISIAPEDYDEISKEIETIKSKIEGKGEYEQSAN
jgi:ParB-like chromosome segregation protein Spo0J